MAMHFFSFSPAQQDAAQRIYTGFYGYATAHGAGPAEATDFANMGLGVASGEGLGKADPWSANADRGVTALGPFQLNLNSGVGSDFGLTRNSGPDAQINAAASTMWNGSSDYYNTAPWNAVGDTPGTGGNNTAAGQSIASDIGARLAAAHGLDGGTALVSPADTSSGDVPLPPSRPDFGGTEPSFDAPDQTYALPEGTASGGNSITAMTPQQEAEMGGGAPAADGGGGGGGGLPGPLGKLFGAAKGVIGGGGGALGGLGGIGGTGGGLGSQGFGSFTPPSGASAPTAAGSDTGQGVPVDITDPTVIASKAGASVQQGAQQLGEGINKTGQALDQQLGTSTQQVTKTATDIANLEAQVFQNPDTGLLPRIGVGLAAIVLIAMGLWMLEKQA